MLKHGQGHYDMAELYALRLKKATREANTNCDDLAQANAAGQKMGAQFQKGWEDAERKYEQDTRYGTDPVKQTAASNRIAREVAALSTYRE